MPTVTASIAATADDGAYTSTAFNSTRATESWINGSQYLRFQSVAVPAPRRCVVDSATLQLTGSILATSSPTIVWSAQNGASAALTSGPDATARSRTATTATFTFNAGLLGANYTVPLTSVIAEAVNAPTWTVGSALALFGVQHTAPFGLTPMSFYTSDSGALTSAAQKPILTVTWHPAGDAAPGYPTVGFTRTGRKNARGGVSGLHGHTFTRAGRKNARGISTGTYALTFVRSGRKNARGAVTGTLVLTFARTGRKSTRGLVLGQVVVAGARTGRSSRRGITSGAFGLTFARSGRAARRGGVSGVAHTSGQTSGRSLRSGVAAGHVATRGLVLGSPGRRGRVAGPGGYAYSVLHGLTGRSGVITGRVVGSGQVQASTRRRGAATSGNARLAGSVAGRHGGVAELLGGASLRGGATTGAPGHLGTLCGTGRVTPAAQGSTHRQGRVAGRLVGHGWISSRDARSGLVAGQVQVGGQVGGQAGGAGAVSGNLALTHWRRGLAGRAGIPVPGRFASNPHLTGQAVHQGTLAGSAHVAGGVAGARQGLGQARGHTGIDPGTTIGTAARHGSVHGQARVVSATINSAPGRMGTVGSDLRAPRGFNNGRTGRRSLVSGTVAPSGSVSGSAARTAGRLAGAFSTRAGASARPTHRARVASDASITGRVAGSLTDVGTTHGTATIDGAVRAGLHAARGQVTGLAVTRGLTAGKTSRTGERASGHLPATTPRGDGRPGGQGATHGTITLTGRLDAPVDFSGAVSGAATLRSRLKGTAAPPAEVAHDIIRVPAKLVIPVVPATITRANVIPTVATKVTYRAPVPVASAPTVKTAVTVKTPAKGVVTRG